MIKENGLIEPTTIWNKNFICVMVANFLLCLAHFTVNPLVATYVRYLGITDGAITGLLAGMFFGVALAMRPFTGSIVTKIDKRKLLVFVFILGAAANLGYALFHNVFAFVAFRVVHGIQFSLIGLVLMTLAGDHLPKSRMISGMGMFGIGGAVASAVAPAIGDALVRLGTNMRDESLGFTLMFLFGMVILAVAVVPTLILAPDSKTKEEAASTGVWYKNILTRHAIPPAIVIFLMIMPHSMIQSYMFNFGDEQGIAGIGAFYLVLALTLAVSRPLSGALTDRFGLDKIMFPGLALAAVALFVIGSSSATWMVIVGAVIFAIGFGSSQPSIQAMCMQTETPLRRGVAGNTLYIGLDLGLFLGPIIGGAVRNQTDLAVMYKTSSSAFILAIIAFVIILPIYKRRLAALEELG